MFLSVFQAPFHLICRYRIVKSFMLLSFFFTDSSFLSSLPNLPSLSPYQSLFYNVCFSISLPPSLFAFPIPLPMPSLFHSHICTHCPHPFFPSLISSFSQCQPFCLPLPLSHPHLSIPSPPLLLHLPFIYAPIFLHSLSPSPFSVHPSSPIPPPYQKSLPLGQACLFTLE